SLKISQFFPDSTPIINESSYESEDENNKSEDENNNEGMTKQEKIISEAIEFVNEVIRKEQLSDTEKACYTAVLYFFWLLLNGKKKIETSEAVAEVTSGRPWLAK
ncbi:3618_t:CDS:1, partial [Diversispora eburnea]